jgi:hypothetical protein
LIEKPLFSFEVIHDPVMAQQTGGKLAWKPLL